MTKFSRKAKSHVCTYGIVIGDKWQGQGYGLKICDHMIKIAWKKGFEKIWLTTYFENMAAFTIYKKLGFEVEGIFLNEEKLDGKNRHVISMGLFKNKREIKKIRQRVINSLN